MSEKLYCVYILSNFSRTVLYTGVTEAYEDPTTAIEREKQIKNYSRKRKEEIILKFNPKLKDLYSELV